MASSKGLFDLSSGTRGLSRDRDVHGLVLGLPLGL